MNCSMRMRLRTLAAKIWADGLLFEALEGLVIFLGEPLDR